MSSEVAVQAEGLGKCYQIYDKPQDRLKQTLFRGRRQFYREFWALQDVSLKVLKGETVGIIGWVRQVDAAATACRNAGRHHG